MKREAFDSVLLVTESSTSHLVNGTYDINTFRHKELLFSDCKQTDSL